MRILYVFGQIDRTKSRVWNGWKHRLYFLAFNLVVSAPTASGKTTIFELAILQLLLKMEEIKYKGDFKIVYSK